MTFEMREPLQEAAHERCACGKESLAPAQWDRLAKATRKWRFPPAHRPARQGGCAPTDTVLIDEPPAHGILADANEEAELEADQPETPGGAEIGKPPSADGLAMTAGQPRPFSKRLRKDDATGLFLQIPGVKPGYIEWRTEAALKLKEYLRKHETYFADDFNKETGLMPFPGVNGSMAGIVRAAEAANWMERTAEMRMHYPTHEGQPWGGKYYRVWKSLLYPDQDPVPRAKSDRPGRTCKVEGCTRRLRPNNLSGICTPHRMMVPGRKRHDLISDALRKAVNEGRLVVMQIPNTSPSPAAAGVEPPRPDLPQSVSGGKNKLDKKKKRPYTKKEVKKKMTDLDKLVLASTIGDEMKRARTTVHWHARRLGLTHKVVGRSFAFSEEDAQKLREALAKAMIQNSRRTRLGRTRRTHKHDQANGEPPKQVKHQATQAPIGKWLMLQMEQAGVTYCLYEKGKGITIRRQRVVEDEESYD